MSEMLNDKRTQLKDLQRQVRALEDKEREEREYPEIKKLEGTFWKFRNSYSRPGEESDYWWLYRYVKKVFQNGTLLTTEFQIDQYQALIINTNRKLEWDVAHYTWGGWVASHAEEWHEALYDVRSRMTELQIHT